MGRRAHKPDPAQRRQVEAMAAYGIPEYDIARVLAVDPKTLRKHYRDELGASDFPEAPLAISRLLPPYNDAADFGDVSTRILELAGLLREAEQHREIALVTLEGADDHAAHQRLPLRDLSYL